MKTDRYLKWKKILLIKQNIKKLQLPKNKMQIKTKKMQEKQQEY